MPTAGTNFLQPPSPIDAADDDVSGLLSSDVVATVTLSSGGDRLLGVRASTSRSFLVSNAAVEGTAVELLSVARALAAALAFLFFAASARRRALARARARVLTFALGLVVLYALPPC